MPRFLPMRTAALLAALSLGGAAALAGEFSVTPVRVEFNGAARTQLLAITNTGSTPAKFLVRGAGWSMSETGAVTLTDSDSLVVFPASFTLAPKATQNIRIGTAERPAETEKTWRVVLEEVPDASAPVASGATINVLSMISVPVFMRPLAPRTELELSWGGATGPTARVSLANSGNAHALVGAVTVTSLRGQDEAQTARVEGWYVLPGKRRDFAIGQGGTPWCAPGVTSLRIVASDVQGQPLASKTLDAAEACR